MDRSAELARCDREIAALHAYGESLGDECPLWLSAMGHADWLAEKHLIEQEAG